MASDANQTSEANLEAVALFKKKAAEVSTLVIEVPDLSAALDQAARIAAQADPAERLPTGSPQTAREIAGSPKRLAAPDLSEADYAYLAGRCQELGVEILKGPMRERLSGLEAAFSLASLGLADTATCVMENETEDCRLASMVCETHVLGLYAKDVVQDGQAGLAFLEAALDRERNFVSFISGASRTSDIERVLTLGVHGPLRLVVALIGPSGD
ncbi:MAG: LUD domain-containing protein [Deltaproteobacteria bacterium]|jgi:L-lactate dehydrogenase complex protein LldG|nr:LUD domain-containing protein [Deltaproteobacteria bacterium]